jgi:uncharacterized coiled-coil protein SlyX
MVLRTDEERIASLEQSVAELQKDFVPSRDLESTSSYFERKIDELSKAFDRYKSYAEEERRRLLDDIHDLERKLP